MAQRNVTVVKVTSDEIAQEIDRVTEKYDLVMPEREFNRIMRSAALALKKGKDQAIQNAVQWAIDNF